MNKAMATALLLMTTGLALCAPQPKTDWVKYESAEGRYSILFPNKPEVNPNEWSFHAASSPDQTTLYMVGYLDKKGATYSFDKARDGVISMSKGVLLAERAISLGDYPGREFKVAMKGPNDADYISLFRHYDVGHRVYILQVSFPKADESASTERTAKFFDSFAVVSGALPGDSAQLIQALWDKRMTKCGDNQWAEVFGGIAEYKHFSWVATEIPISDIDRNLNHVEWRVSTSVRQGIPYRVWNPVWKRWDREWTPLGGELGGDMWGNSLQMQVEKKNGIVTFSGAKYDSYNPKHLNCSALPSD